MGEAVSTAALLIVLWGAYARAAGVIVGLARTLLGRARFRTFRTGWVEYLTWLEPFLLGGCTYVLYGSRDQHFVLIPTPATSATEIAGAVAGAILVVGAYALLLWSFRSWPALFVGHAVLPGHRLVSHGAYGFVRHPVYLAALLVWLGLGVAFGSGVTLAITLLYVLPTYVFYARSEEAMMLEAFGEAYRQYRRTVPMFVPRPG
jgi:protein-S-isoprenylcysteine O-methyltransferase Ste14